MVQVDKRFFNSRYMPINTSKHRNIYCYGGSSSGKSVHIAMYLILCAYTGEGVLIARATKVSLRGSVWLELKGAIHTLNLAKHFKLNSTEMTILCKTSAGSIQMVGCDKEESVRSIKPLKQKSFTKLWLEEADGIPNNMFIQLNLRMRGKPIGGFRKQTIVSFNPTYEDHYINQDYMKPLGWNGINDWDYDDGKNLIIRSTYKDNKWLDEEEIEYLEDLGKVSKYHEQVYLNAEWGVLGEHCIEHYEEWNGLFEDVQHLPAYIGMDLGWTDDLALSIMRVDSANRIIYVVDGFVGKKMTHIEIANKIKIYLERNNISQYHPIYADSEDPRLVKMIASQGVNCIGAKKPQGSVLNGIMIMNSYTFKIKWNDAFKAFSNYTWIQDKKTGKSTQSPNHTFSHIPDSCRYGLEQLLTGFVNTYGLHLN